MIDEFEAIMGIVPCPLADDFTNALDATVDYQIITPEEWFDYNAAYMAMSV